MNSGSTIRQRAPAVSALAQDSRPAPSPVLVSVWAPVWTALSASFCNAAVRRQGAHGGESRQWRDLILALLLGAGLLAVGGGVQAQQQIGDGSFVVADIRVQGLQRVSAGNVFNLLPVNVGDRVDQRAGQEIIRSLFASGFFSDIRVGRDGDVLVIMLSERPAIDSIQIEGNKSIPTDALLEGLRDSGLAEGEIFRRATLERVDLELERQYVGQGRYGASIDSVVEELPRNRVAIRINIEEGSVAKVRHLNIVGNSVYSDRELLDQFELKLPSPLFFWRSDDRYSREKLGGDLERLEAYYRDSGYVNFRIDSTQVSINPDKSEVYITINVDEGEKHTIGDVQIAGELSDVPVTALEPLLLVFPGQTFSQALITFSEERLVAALGNAGYTFANATGVPQVNEEDQTVDIRFFVDAGQRAYVRRIDFRGNTVTQDQVLRREMRQFEGGWASTAQIDLSKVRLERLGYFRDVRVETPAVPGSDNQIDVLFSVREQPSGSISATLGYSQVSGVILGAQYEERNVFGSGNSLGLGVSWSRFQQSVSFNFFDPYFTVDGISRGFNVFARRTNFDERNIARFSTDAYGAGMNFGYPISETQRVSFGLSSEYTKITQGRFPALEIVEFLAEEGGSFLNFSATAGWSQSQLDRGLFPTRGSSQNLSLQASIPGSDLLFWRLRYEGQRFFPFGEGFSLRLHTKLGYGDGYGGTDSMPFFEHFFAGGFGSVRGYETNTLGPRATPAPNDPFIRRNRIQPFGGNVLITGGLELIVPMPFVEDQRQFRPVLFLDAGNVFNTSCPSVSQFCDGPTLSEIRYSVGMGVTWLTGLGPITVGIARALNSKPGDDTEFFQFELGRTF
ncbi:MAG: outer membrane protein assembly factor BamA [Gammaproteobacteria bacterium]|nr:outer membrane protein assembly factor BamA [Gammaproteobacteria bacterium]